MEKTNCLRWALKCNSESPGNLVLIQIILPSFLADVLEILEDHASEERLRRGSGLTLLIFRPTTFPFRVVDHPYFTISVPPLPPMPHFGETRIEFNLCHAIANIVS